MASSPPSSFHNGESQTWTVENSKYPASSGWKCEFAASGANGGVTLPGVASSDAFVITLTAAQSAALGAGIYTYAHYFTKDAEAAYDNRGEFVVLLAPGRPKDESPNEKKLRLCNEALEGRLADPVEASDILGVNITKVSAEELERMLHRFQGLVNDERKRDEFIRTGRRRRFGRVFFNR